MPVGHDHETRDSGGTSLRDRVADADHITELHNLRRSCLATRTVIQDSWGILIALNGSRGLLSGSEPDIRHSQGDPQSDF